MKCALVALHQCTVYVVTRLLSRGFRDCLRLAAPSPFPLSSVCTLYIAYIQHVFYFPSEGITPANYPRRNPNCDKRLQCPLW